MTSLLSGRMLVILSICYGLCIAAVAVFNGPVTPVAIVGALALGGLWAVRGVLGRRD